jgi:hypothetical protein
MLRFFFLGAVCSGLTMSLYGCAGYRASKTGPTVQDTENLVYLDFALKVSIPCETLNAEQLPSGRTRVHARFVNRQNHTAECQIKVRFKDSEGRILDETGWMPLLLPRREVTQFEHTSLCTGAKDFTILLRAAKG